MGEEEIIQNILSHCSDLTREEIMAIIEKKKVASGGLLTNEAAARLVAAECGVEIKLAKALPRINIAQLIAGLTDVTVYGRVLLVAKPRVFSRPDGNGQLTRLLIADKTGTIQVALWDEKAELAKKIQARQIVKVLHGYVRQSRGETELNVGQRGDIQTTPTNVKESDFPYIEYFLEKIHNITSFHKKVNLEGTIQAIYPLSSFQRNNGTQGKVIRILLYDETGTVPVVFWNEKAEKIAEAEKGTLLLLINAKVKRGRQDGLLELHVDDFADVEILDSRETSLCINDLKEGMIVPSIEGKVATTPILREVTTRKGEKVSVASFELEDNTGKIWVSAWRSHAKKVRGLTVGVKVVLRDVYVQKGFGNQLEITTRSSTEIETEQ